MKNKIDFVACKKELDEHGFSITGVVFSNAEIEGIEKTIKEYGDNRNGNTQTKELYAIRSFFKVMPELSKKIFTPVVKAIISNVFGSNYFLVKAIYFDKPPLFNWLVAWHQDLSVTIDKKVDLPAFKNWTTKGQWHSAQPPVEILQSIYTMRIHLDDCTGENGALHVVPASHKQAVIATANIAQLSQHKVICAVNKGGIMLMRPLLLHASQKTTVEKNRRVLHLEFSNLQLPAPADWAEKQLISYS